MKEDMHSPDNGNARNQHESVPTLVNLPNGRQALVGRGLVKKFGRGQYGPKPTSRKAVEVAFRNFPDGTRLRVICGPRDPSRTIFAVRKEGKVQLVDRFEHGPEVFVPPRRDDPLIRSMVLPRGVQPHDAPSAMARRSGALLNEVVPLTEAEQLVLGNFVLMTHASDGLPLAPTVAFRGPRDITFPLLQALGLLCRYGLVIGDVTPAGLLETCSRVRPTLLIADYGLRRDTMRLLDMGSRLGISSLQKGGAFSPYCPRAIACSDSTFPRDLLSGGVMISLRSLGWPNLGRLSDSGFLERASCHQRQLLDYDLVCNGTIRPLEGELSTGMKPREWDAFSCWGAPFTEEKAFLRELREAMRLAAELSPDGLPVDQYATISALEFLAHKPQTHTSVGEIAALANKVLEQMGEDLCLKARKVGAILMKLGFPRRERGGDDGPYQLEFNGFSKDQIHRLVKFYGRWQVELYSSDDPRVMCSLCREYKLVSEGDLRWCETELKPREERRKREEEEKHKRRMERLRKNPPPPLFPGARDGRAAKS